MSGQNRNGGPPDDRGDVAKPLGFLVQQEARRALSEAQLQGDPARLAAGWERRFIADRRRADEMSRLYENLGYEVCTDPVRPEEMGEDCDDCQLLIQLGFKTIYTRKSGRE